MPNTIGMLQPKALYENQTDTDLFAMIRQDDVKAFEELYRRYWTFLVDTAYKRLQCRERAEDLVQDLFVSLYHKRQAVEIAVSLKAYLGTALKYKILNEFRSVHTRQAYQKSQFVKTIYQNDISGEIEAKDLNRKVDQVLASLPRKCRAVFLLSRKGHRSNKDISQAMRISVSTVEKHIGKALKVLRTSLPEYGRLAD